MKEQHHDGRRPKDDDCPRPCGTEDAALPRWMQAIDTFTPAKALAMGIALSAVNPKNLLLTVAAATAHARDSQTGCNSPAGSRQARFLAFPRGYCCGLASSPQRPNLRWRRSRARSTSAESRLAVAAGLAR
jgi:hypothetical protein